MAVLNITYQGVSVEYSLEVDENLSDADIKRVAVEVIRSGELQGLHIGDLADGTFSNFVVDRFDNRGSRQRFYLRPKVPFGVF